MRAVGATGLTVLTSVAMADEAPRLALPSGGEAWLQEVLSGTSGEDLTYRFRFVQEGFEMREERFHAVMSDLAYLCESYAAPRLADLGRTPGQVVISLASAPGPFGVHIAGVEQVFEAFSVEGGSCIWEEF